MNARLRDWIHGHREREFDRIGEARRAKSLRGVRAGWRRLALWDLLLALHMIAIGQ